MLNFEDMSAIWYAYQVDAGERLIETAHPADTQDNTRRYRRGSRLLKRYTLSVSEFQRSYKDFPDYSDSYGEKLDSMVVCAASAEGTMYRQVSVYGRNQRTARIS